MHWAWWQNLTLDSLRTRWTLSSCYCVLLTAPGVNTSLTSGNLRHIAVNLALICDACRFCSHSLSSPGIASGKNQAIILELDVMVPAQYTPFLIRCRKQRSDVHIFNTSPSPFPMRFFYNIMHHINTVSIPFDNTQRNHLCLKWLFCPLLLASFRTWHVLTIFSSLVRYSNFNLTVHIEHIIRLILNAFLLYDKDAYFLL